MKNIKSTTPLLFVILFFAASTAFSQFADLTYSTVSSDAVRLDLRDDFGGRIAQGSMILSKEEGMITCDGNPIGAIWDTTLLTDGWHILSCNGENIQVCIRNDSSICLEEGRLVENTVWDNSMVHVVRNNVYVSKGVTLTITEGTTVKFAEDSQIIVENGGKLQMTGSEEAYVQFAMVTDDSYAGDTDMREQAVELPTYAVINCESSGTLTDNGFIVSQGLVISSTYPSVQLHSAVVQEAFGEVFLALTLSGTRKSGFYVEWEATNGTASYGEDYMLAKGKETWTSTDNGTTFIRIPLVSGHLADDEETFSVRLVSSGGANITTEGVTVTIQKSNDAGLSGLVYSNGISGKVRLDLRDSFGGRIIRGNISFSEMEGNAAVNGTNVSSPWRSTSVEDGWHELSQGGHTQEVCVLNHDSVALEEGRIIQNTTWDDTAVHLLRNDVYVPNGVTLTLAAGAVVKFTEDTRIVIEHGGKVSVQGTENSLVQFALANNDAVGGDTDMRETNMDIPEVPLLYCYNGNDFLDNGFFATRNVKIASLPEVTLHNARVFEGEGVVRIAVTISGSRTRPFWLDWEAVDGTATYGNDFTLRRGQVTWNNVSEGTKYIEIPLVTDDMDEGLEYFTVSVISCGGVNTLVDMATVDIDEEGEGMPGSGGNYGFMSAISAQPVCVDARIMPMRLGQEQENVAYSQLWTYTDGANSATVTLQQLDSDEDAVLLVSSNNMEPEGVVTIDTTNLPSGKYLLAHETMNAKEKVLERLESSFFLNRDAIVHDDVIQSAEVWTSEKVHIISGDVVVPKGVELIIEDGAVVKFMDGTSLTAKTGGSIIANVVIFTHIADDNAGGDSNLDGDATSPVSDVYQLTGFTTGDACELRYITLTFEGGTISDTKVLQGNRVHKVTGNIAVASGGKLIVQPGAIVKMSEGLSINVHSGGTLEAVGSRAQPIVFTSIKDDAYGGDTNGDGDKSAASGGDWKYIYVQGQANLQYCALMYGAPSNETGIIETAGNGVLEMDCCTVAHAKYDGVWNWGGSITVRNSIITDVGLGAAPYRGSKNEYTNCVFFEDNYLAMYWSHWSGNPVFNNCVFKNMGNDWLDTNGYSNAYNAVSFNHCLFHNDEGLAVQSCVKSGVDGCLYADPLFTDADNGDFTLRAGSPCIDAGDGIVAPETDYYGQPRQDIREVADTGIAGESGAVPDIGIHEMLAKNSRSDVDLSITEIELSETELAACESLTVSWTVANLGSKATDGAWRDRIYLVTSSNREVELGSLVHTGNISSNGVRTVKKVISIPIVNDGLYRIRVRVNSDHDIYEGSLTDNNVMTSAEILCHVPETEIQDNQCNGSLSAGENILKLCLGGREENVGRLRLLANAVVMTGNGFVPDANHCSSLLNADDSGSVMFELPEDCDKLYILVVSPEDAAYSLELSKADIEIGSIAPNVLPCSGVASILVSGVGLDNASSVMATRQDGADGVQAESIRRISPEQLLVFFDCAKFSAGEVYSLHVATETSMTSKKDAFGIGNGIGSARIVSRLVLPDTVRAGRKYLCKVEYRNTGNVDAPLPIFEVEIQGDGTLVNVDETISGGKSLSFLGAGNPQTTGTIRPGESFEISFFYIAGRNDRVLLRSSDDDYHADGWENAAAFQHDISEAAFRIGARGQDATNYKSVVQMAQMLRDGEDAGSSVFGRILDAEKTPVSEVPVAIYADADCNVFVGIATTSPTGHYCFSELKAGTYYLLPACIAEGTSISCIERNRMECHVGESVDVNVDIALNGLRSITGIIDDNDTYIVTLSNPSNGEQITQEAKNSFHYYALEPGWYHLKCSAGNKGQSCWVDFSDGEAITLSISPKQKYDLAGFIENHSELGGQLQKAIVCAETEDGDNYLACLDEDGWFSFEGLVEGKYTLSIANCPYAGDIDVELHEDTRGVSFAVELMDTDYTRGILPWEYDYLEQLRGENLWSEFWGECLSVAQKPFKVAFEPFFNWLNERQKPYQELFIRAFTLVSNHSVREPEGIYNCSHNHEKYVEDKCFYDMFVLKTEHYQRIVHDSNSIKAIGETCQLVATIGDIAFDYTLGKFTKGSHHWVKISMELISILKASVKEISEVIDFCDNNGTMELFKEEDKEFIESLTFPEEGIFAGAASSAANIELIMKVLTNSKRIETMLQGIKNHKSILVARGYPLTKLGKFSKFLVDIASFSGKLVKLGEQAKKTAYEITTFILSSGDLQELTLQMQEACAEFEQRAKSFNNYLLCCTKCEPPLPVDSEYGMSTVQSIDPNEMAGMYGFGDSATQRFVESGEEMTYTVYFENKSDATAAAQEVKVTGQLSKWLDWESFQVAEVGFRNQIDNGLAGKSSGTSEVPLEGTVWKVRTEVEVNRKNGQVKFYLRIVDDTTVDGWPASAYDGFLSPNDDRHSGEGYVRYKVKVRKDAPNGVRIDADATIVFDYNEPITTSPAWFNWVNADKKVVVTGVLTWDAVEGASYEVAIWSGDPDKSGEKAVVEVSSGALSENKWRLPDTLADGVTYFWQVTTTDGEGNVGRSPVWGFDLGGRVRYNLTPGWNLISLPFKPDAYSEMLMVGLGVYGLSDGSYVRRNALTAGDGCWMFLREASVFDVLPMRQTREAVAIPLRPGWNLIGPTEAERYLEGDYTVWSWQGGGMRLLEADAYGGYMLEAGKGYWVYCQEE